MCIELRVAFIWASGYNEVEEFAIIIKAYILAKKNEEKKNDGYQCTGMVGDCG